MFYIFCFFFFSICCYFRINVLFFFCCFCFSFLLSSCVAVVFFFRNDLKVVVFQFLERVSHVVDYDWDLEKKITVCISCGTTAAFRFGSAQPSSKERRRRQQQLLAQSHVAAALCVLFYFFSSSATQPGPVDGSVGRPVGQALLLSPTTTTTTLLLFLLLVDFCLFCSTSCWLHGSVSLALVVFVSFSWVD